MKKGETKKKQKEKTNIRKVKEKKSESKRKENFEENDTERKHLRFSSDICFSYSVLYSVVNWLGKFHCSKVYIFTYIFNIWFVNTFCRYTLLNDQIVLFLTIQFNRSQQS